MAHGDTRKGKWRGNWRLEWVASTFHTTSEHGVSSITTADAHTTAASSRLNFAPADLNGLVRFAERRNLFSARVPSHFKRSLTRHSEGLIWVLFLFCSGELNAVRRSKMVDGRGDAVQYVVQPSKWNEMSCSNSPISLFHVKLLKWKYVCLHFRGDL